MWESGRCCSTTAFGPGNKDPQKLTKKGAEYKKAEGKRQPASVLDSYSGRQIKPVGSEGMLHSGKRAGEQLSAIRGEDASCNTCRRGKSAGYMEKLARTLIRGSRENSAGGIGKSGGEAAKMGERKMLMKKR